MKVRSNPQTFLLLFVCTWHQGQTDCMNVFYEAIHRASLIQYVGKPSMLQGRVFKLNSVGSSGTSRAGWKLRKVKNEQKDHELF